MAQSDSSAALYRDIFEASTDPIMVHDPETGAIVAANPAAGDLLGRDHEALIGMSVGAFSAPGFTSEDAIETMETALSAGEHQIEWSVVSADGDTHTVRVSLKPTTLQDETRVIAFIDDITTKKQTERLATEQTEHLRTLVDNLPVVAFTLDPEGRFTQSRGKGLESLGLEPDELVGVSVYDAYAEYDDITAAVDQALDGEEVRVTQEIDDLVFETWYRPVFEDGELVQVVAVARDVSALKRREERAEALSDATKQLLYARDDAEVADVVTEIAQRIIDRPITAMWSYDESEDTLYPLGATTKATTFAGAMSVSDLPPMPPGTDEYDIFHDGEITTVEDYQELSNPSAPGVPLRTMLCFPLEDHGLLCIGSDEVQAFSDTEQLLLEILASTATAALDRVEREAELAAYRTELERSNEALQQFAYIASHDLQEPLRMVSSYMDLLEAEYGDQLDEEASEYMAFATEGAQRMKQMIDGLLSYSRVETRGNKPEVVAADTVLDSTVRELSLLLEESDTDVAYGSLPAVEVDRAQVGQLFQNLLKNAVVHGDASTVTVSATTLDDRVEFVVADDGTGIPLDQQDDIFGIFEQGVDADDGSGIGLAVCERIVNRHDGEIRVDSKPGAGARFVFTLPQPAEAKR